MRRRKRKADDLAVFAVFTAVASLIPLLFADRFNEGEGASSAGGDEELRLYVIDGKEVYMTESAFKQQNQKLLL